MKATHGYTLTVEVECPHGSRCRPADEIMLNLMREVRRRLAPYKPRVDLELYAGSAGWEPQEEAFDAAGS